MLHEGRRKGDGIVDEARRRRDFPVSRVRDNLIENKSLGNRDGNDNPYPRPPPLCHYES